MIKAIGTIVYNDLSGGFWGIKGDDGKKYAPVDLPKSFQEDGRRVEVEMERVQVMSIRMWGINVTIKKIQNAL